MKTITKKDLMDPTSVVKIALIQRDRTKGKPALTGTMLISMRSATNSAIEVTQAKFTEAA